MHVTRKTDNAQQEMMNRRGPTLTLRARTSADFFIIFGVALIRIGDFSLTY